jgi:hypothetical protein
VSPTFSCFNTAELSFTIIHKPFEDISLNLN